MPGSYRLERPSDRWHSASATWLIRQRNTSRRSRPRPPTSFARRVTKPKRSASKAEQEGRQAALATVQQVLDQQVAEQLETLLPALRGSIEEIQNAKHAWLSHWHAEAVHIAASIAGRVVRRELIRQPEITLDLVREALQLAAGSADITLKTQPGRPPEPEAVMSNRS